VILCEVAFDLADLRLCVSREPVTQKRAPVFLPSRVIAGLASGHGVAKDQFTELSDWYEVVCDDSTVFSRSFSVAKDAYVTEFLPYTQPLRR